MAWHKIAVLGLLASAAFAGCTVTTDDPDGDGGGSGGEDGSGGSSSGGAKATGGSSSGGAKATGGSSSGGKAGDGGPATCGSTGNDCLKCVKEKCCEEYIACGDDPACSQSSGHPGELICIQDCLIDQVGDAAAIDVQECAGRCAEDSSGVSTATSDLIACIRADDDTTDGGVALQNCSEICFGSELP